MKWQLVAILCVVSLAVGVAAGVYWLAPALTQHHYTETIIERPAAIKEVVKTVTQTEVVYVPKETDPATGQPEKTDVQAEIKQPTVNVKVNGQPYSFGLLQGETQKFERGKITLDQASEIGIKLEVKPQIIDRTKTGGIDLFVGRYSGVGVQFNRIGLDIGTNGRDQDYRLRWRAVEW
jgi:hypothetical protein